MCRQAGLEVARLRRVRVGTLTLEGVPYGQYRKLTPVEVKKLKNANLQAERNSNGL
jgi:16S rRNA U516 pseudouridylate synthase RsuA-like enzyme